MGEPKRRNPEVDAYLAAAPEAAQPILRALRELVEAEAPAAEERISYGMPSYHHHGRLVYFAAQKKHVGVYGLVGAEDAAPELARYLAERGTLRIPFGEPVPLDALRSALRARVAENEQTTRGSGAAR